jgi:CDP-diacylglycerol--glycerol-3-phosphate 3-phosphatidyltransferase
MFGEKVRKHSQFFLRPMARFFQATGISPNGLTVLGFVLMVAVGGVIAQGYLLLGGILIIVVVILDAVDGLLARMMNRTTRFGAFLDSTLDRFSEAALFLGLFIHLAREPGRKFEQICTFAALAGSLLVSYVRARAEGIGVPLKDGLLTRFERIFIFCTGLILNQYLLTTSLFLLAILSNFTAIQRMYLVWRYIREKGEE